MSIIYFDLQKAQRDKSKLVYVQRNVTKNGKTFQQGFWVQPSQVKSTDTVLQGNNVMLAYQAAQKTIQQANQNQKLGNFDKSKYVAMYTSGDKIKAMKYAKDNGITWKEHSNPNINWMRCQMAVNKSLNGGTPSTSTKSNSDNNAATTLKTSGLRSDFESLSKKDKIVELLKDNSRDSLIAFAKANGISWKENGNAGINWMRCSMAIQSYLDSHKLTDVNNKASSSQSQQTQPEPDTIEVPVDASPRQKALISMINKISKKEDFDLFGSVGMIAEDDDAKAFMEQKLKPKYEAWKNGHQPSAGSSSGYIIGYGDDFGKRTVEDIGTIFKGLNAKVTRATLETMYNELSLASVLYPRERVRYANLAGKSSNNGSAKAAQNASLNLDNLVKNLNLAFSVRDTKNLSDFQYDGWDSKVYQNFSTDSHGFVKSLEHIKKNNPDLSSECDRMISVYSDMLKVTDGNPKALEYILESPNFSSIKSTIENNKKTMQTELLLAAVFKEHNLTPREAYQTVYYSPGYNYKSEITVCDENGNKKVDASGNPIKINLSSYLSKHQSEYPNLDPSNIQFNSWSTIRTVKQLMEGNEIPSSHIATQFMDSLVTEKNYCEIQRKILEMYNISLKPGSAATFDISSNDPQEWDTNRELYEREIKDNPESDTVLANLQFISAAAKTCAITQRKNGYFTKPSKANNDGTALSKNFNYYARENYGIGSMYMQEKNLSMDEINKAVQSQLNDVPTISKKWIEDSRKYAEKYGNGDFKASFYDDPPTTETEKKCSKALSIDFGSQSAVSGYMGTPVGDLLTRQLTYVSRFCPQMESARHNTPEKVQKQVEKKLGYIPFEFSAPSISTGVSSSELKKQREELYRKVHCSLKSCSTVQYDAIQTQIKHDWDMGKRNSAGNRLYGHISAVFKGAYKVNNSLQEQLMLENAKKLGETPQSFFHGTNHSGATGIIGVDGRFRAPKSAAEASKQGLKYAGGMLGSGVYLAKMAGKSAGYFGTWGAGYDTEGCMLMCKAVLGKTFVSTGFNSNAPSSYDTVSMQAGTNTGRTTLRADEWCVRNPDFVFPEYIVDMGTKRRV